MEGKGGNGTSIPHDCELLTMPSSSRRAGIKVPLLAIVGISESIVNDNKIEEVEECSLSIIRLRNVDVKTETKAHNRRRA